MSGPTVRAFTYVGLPARVVFGAGSLARLPAEVDLLGAKRVLVLSTPRQAKNARAATAALGARIAGYYDQAAMHVPVEVVEDARRAARDCEADACVAVGGGSTIGLGKAIALTGNIPLIAVPTTYSGSEMTAVYGLTEANLKRTAKDLRVLPRCVVYDPALTLALPAATSAASGMNAIAHCVEALYSPDTNPINALMAEEGIRALAASLPRIVRAPDDLEARGEALYGAWLAGVALGAAGMGLHHKLCHTLGGTFNLPHAETHSIVLPHATAYNASAAPEAMARVARALAAASGSQAAAALYDLETALGLRMRLADLGMPEAGIERAAQIATQTPYPNPRPVEIAGVRALLRDAYEGRRPG